jgi:hypothetical protein
MADALRHNTGNGRRIPTPANTINIDSPPETADNPFTQSQIVSSSETASPDFQRIFDLPLFPEGDAGSIAINSDRIHLSHGLININHEGLGNAGDIEIKTEELLLNQSGQITATTREGKGGNIDITAETIRLNENSLITATAEVQGNGGNINIDSTSLIGENNSDILAKAKQGEGGEISIATDQLFGMTRREDLDPSNLSQFQTNEINDIAALSSNNPQFNGMVTVQINNLLPNLEIAPIVIIPPAPQFRPLCQGNFPLSYQHRNTRLRQNKEAMSGGNSE